MISDFSVARFLDAVHSPKQKPRRRSSFNALQVHWLETEFRCHRYLTPERRAQLSLILGLTQQQIKIWFQNRRYKTKMRTQPQPDTCLGRNGGLIPSFPQPCFNPFLHFISDNNSLTPRFTKHVSIPVQNNFNSDYQQPKIGNTAKNKQKGD